MEFEFNSIVDPKTGQVHSLDAKQGLQLLKRYINHFRMKQSGGADVADADINELIGDVIEKLKEYGKEYGKEFVY